MKVSVKDIAQAANVSPGSVSNALNNRKGISDEKREHILKIARQMGYFKSQVDHKVIRLVMLKKEANILGDTPFFSELISGIEDGCSRFGYELAINQMNVTSNLIKNIEDILSPSKSSGVIVLGTELSLEDLKLFQSTVTPMVILDAAYRNQEFDYVAINNVDAAYDITNHLISKGHKNIGLINSSKHINNFGERKIGFLQALYDSNLGFFPENEALVEPSLDGSYKDMKVYLQALIDDRGELPTAYFAVNDNVAIGSLRALKEMELSTISVVGFDNIPMCEFSDPRLTTVDVNKKCMGVTTVARLVEKIEQKDVSTKKILISTTVVKRDSDMDIRLQAQ